MGHHNPHILLQEKRMSGIAGAFYPSMFEPKDAEVREKILRALLDNELVIVDAYIDKDQKPNEDNYMSIGPGKYIGYQDALNAILISSDLRKFLQKNPEYKKVIFPENKQ